MLKYNKFICFYYAILSILAFNMAYFELPKSLIGSILTYGFAIFYAIFVSIAFGLNLKRIE